MSPPPPSPTAAGSRDCPVRLPAAVAVSDPDVAYLEEVIARTLCVSYGGYVCFATHNMIPMAITPGRERIVRRLLKSAGITSINGRRLR